METWETTIVNLGHCHRKLGNLHQAVLVRTRSWKMVDSKHVHLSPPRPPPPTPTHPPAHPPTHKQLYERAVGLCPRRASSYASLAFTHQLLGQLDLAIEYYHRALGLRPDDAFAASMLSRALSEALDLQAEAAVQQEQRGQWVASASVIRTPGVGERTPGVGEGATPPFVTGRRSVAGLSSVGGGELSFGAGGQSMMGMGMDDSYDLDDDDLDEEDEMAG